MKRARQQVVKDERREQYEHLTDLGRLVAGADARVAGSVGGKDDAVLARAFRHQRRQGQGRLSDVAAEPDLPRNARGNFGVLVKAMSRDPAMIDWLDLRESKAAHPNENFAREVMELFTLGEGNYTEKDVTEGARAFTGYRIAPEDQSFRFDVRASTTTRPSSSSAAATCATATRPSTPSSPNRPARGTSARKLWTFFAYENPSDALVETLAASMRASRYEMRPVLHQIFTSAEFYSPPRCARRSRAPMQWMVQTARELEITLPGHGPLQAALRQMGQVPFNPPSVKGWDGGKAWISTSTLLTRYNLAGAASWARPRMHPAAPVLDEEGAEIPETAAGPARCPTARPDLQKLAPAALRADPVGAW